MAVALHVSLSVLVFAAVRSGKLRLFLLAVLLHAAVTAAVVLPAARFYKKMPVFTENT